LISSDHIQDWCLLVRIRPEPDYLKAFLERDGTLPATRYLFFALLMEMLFAITDCANITDGHFREKYMRGNAMAQF
jgi:hypothetical protein